MSDNPLKTINQQFIVVIILLIILGGIVIANVKLIADNLVKSQGIDEKIVSEANPRLNKQLIEQAASLLSSSVSQELTTNTPDVTVDSEPNISEEVAATSIEIQNGSGITGAAAELAEKLAFTGYQVGAISTAPASEDTTSVFFRAGKAEVAKDVEQILLESDWPVTQNEETSQAIKGDILIILGK